MGRQMQEAASWDWEVLCRVNMAIRVGVSEAMIVTIIFTCIDVCA